MKNIDKILIFLTLLSFAFVSNVSAQNSPSSTQAEILIYPNPVTDDNFTVKSDMHIKSVEVLNVIGQCVKKVTNDTGVAYNIFVKLPETDKGMYVVRITFNDNTQYIKKIMIK